MSKALTQDSRGDIKLCNLYHCSVTSGADVINFEGQGVISYRFKMKKMKILKDVISLKFKTTASNGVLLHGEGQQGDYISLELKRSKLLLMINLGNGPFPILSTCVHPKWHPIRYLVVYF